MKYNSNISMLLSGMLLSVSCILCFLSLIYFSNSEICLEFEASIFSSNKITLLILLDFMSCFFCSVVMLISGSVMLFSSAYMEADKFNHRFTLIVLLFVISMMFLIFSPSLLSLLLGWDGLGVTSYLLVCYYSSEKSFNASMLTAMTNRLGDVLILLFIAQNTTPGMFNYGISSFSSEGCLFFMVFVTMAAMTKSAQIPFSAWLPAAMAAPTPVSALVHSSTLVTAGAYLLIRLNYLLLDVLSWLIWVGVLTMLMAGVAALMELDMKKIIALSTLSQLGVLMFTLGAGEPLLSWFHLISHAYFKAMLFMGAGSMIHTMKDYQDLRKMGSWALNNHYTGSVFLVGSMSLCGLPFMTGFYSKDSILEQYLMMESSAFMLILVMIATFCTAAYSARIVMLLFNSASLREVNSAEAMGLGRLSLGSSTLTVYSVAGGWILFGFSNPLNLVEIPTWLKSLVLSGVLLTGLTYSNFPYILSPSGKNSSGFHQMWFLPLTLSPGSVNSGLNSSKSLFKTQEMAWLNWSAGLFMMDKTNSKYGVLSFYSKTLTSLSVMAWVMSLMLVL